MLIFLNLFIKFITTKLKYKKIIIKEIFFLRRFVGRLNEVKRSWQFIIIVIQRCHLLPQSIIPQT